MLLYLAKACHGLLKARARGEKLPQPVAQVIYFLHSSSSGLKLELGTDPAQRPRPEEKLELNALNTRYYLDSNFGKAHELFGWLDKE